MLYTSGSTGSPKGLVHTQAGYLLYAALTHKVGSAEGQGLGGGVPLAGSEKYGEGLQLGPELFLWQNNARWGAVPMFTYGVFRSRLL